VPPQHADGHRPEDAILLAVDQELGEVRLVSLDVGSVAYIPRG
jgi:hypothetical protein